MADLPLCAGAGRGHLPPLLRPYRSGWAGRRAALRSRLRDGPVELLRKPLLPGDRAGRLLRSHLRGTRGDAGAPERHFRHGRRAPPAVRPGLRRSDLLPRRPTSSADARAPRGGRSPALRPATARLPLLCAGQPPGTFSPPALARDATPAPAGQAAERTAALRRRRRGRARSLPPARGARRIASLGGTGDEGAAVRGVPRQELR